MKNKFMEFKPSEYQEDIFEFIKYGYGNAVVSAVSGSGKSTTIVKSLEYIKPNKTVLFLAFNNGIVKKLKNEIVRENTDIKTLHSLGFSILKYNFKEKDIVLYQDKYYDKLSTYLSSIDSDYIDNVKYNENILKLCDLGRYFLIKDKKELLFISNKYSLVLIDNELDVAEYLINWGKTSLEETNLIDYTDMIYLPNVLNVKVFKYDFIIIDEAQDLSVSQMSLFMKCFKQGSRFIAVGDNKQCQPEGTRILMSNGEFRNIEDININDKVVSYDRHEKGQFVGYYKNHRWGADNMSKYGININNISKRPYNGDLIVIEAAGMTSKYTPDHKCMVRFKKNSIGRYIVYLMEKNGLFRIGISPLLSLKGDIFGTMRAKGESADNFWILNTYNNRFEAYTEEQYYSVEYSIPQMIFNHRQQSGNITQSSINDYYNRFDKIKLKLNAEKLLNLFGRLYEKPLWSHAGKNYFSKTHMFEINACNIIANDMEIIIFDDTNITKTNKRNNKISPKYCEIDKMYKENYNGHVYSLEVNKYELYIADGILTHNCINSFAGSDIESFNKLKKTPNTIELPLSISYRCPKNIVKFAQKLVPEIEYFENAIDGFINFNAKIEDIKDGDLIICRNTLPLVKLYIKLIEGKIKCYLKGNDVGLNLIDLIQHIEQEDLIEVFNELDNMRLQYIKINKQIDESEDEKIYSTQSYNDLLDKIDCLKILSNGIKTKQELTDKIFEIFSDDSKQGICLSTIHKAKGMEADNVYILNKNLTPSKYAKQEWEIEQERNLEYVSFTRSKKLLGFIYDS